MQPEKPSFKFIEFNPIRAERGIEAARVEITDDGVSYWLWMSVEDIRINIRKFGDHPELQAALDAYFGS